MNPELQKIKDAHLSKNKVTIKEDTFWEKMKALVNPKKDVPKSDEVTKEKSDEDKKEKSEPAPAKTESELPISDFQLQLQKIREEHERKEEHQKMEALYNKAIEKEIIKENTMDALKLQRKIVEDFASTQELINTTPEPKKVRTQNLQKEVEEIQRNALQRSGVEYINKPQ